MMWEEFEKLAGYEVTYSDYHDIIEPMYMATNLSKSDFIACLDKKRFALKTKRQLVHEMKKAAGFIFEYCGACSFHEEMEDLEKLAYEYAERFHGFSRNNLDTWVGFESDYAYRGVPQDRGCTYPKVLVIGKNGTELERIQLVKV